MGMFKNTLLLAQQGNEKAMEKLLNRYDPLLKKCSIIQGHFDEDLYQSLIHLQRGGGQRVRHRARVRSSGLYYSPPCPG